MPPPQVLGLRQQRIAQADARRQRLRPSPAVEVLQKGIEDERALAFMAELERLRSDFPYQVFCDIAP